MPHFLDKHILNALHARWPEEFNRTSSHRFRTGDDMQFAFSYMYFMMHQVRSTHIIVFVEGSSSRGVGAKRNQMLP